MSFIPGRFLSPGVAQQVNARQDILGNRERLMADGANPETFSFFLKKVPFVKLTSAIDVNGSADLAKKFTLDNGVKSAKSGTVPGYEETSNLGYRPTPGITGMQLSTHNRFGSLRTATVSFEVHSVDQLDQYEQLFMRPGYSALLEWGNSYYLDNQDKQVKEVTEILSDRFLDQEGLSTKLSIYAAIDELRTKYSYNYDAMYGLLKNFRWSIRPDGGYSCTVDLVSVGTIIESLNINTGVTAAQLNSYRSLVQKNNYKSGKTDTRNSLEGDGTRASTAATALSKDNKTFYDQAIVPLLDGKFDLVRQIEAQRETFLDKDELSKLNNLDIGKSFFRKGQSAVFVISIDKAQSFIISSEPYGGNQQDSVLPEYYETKLYRQISTATLPGSSPDTVFIAKFIEGSQVQKKSTPYLGRYEFDYWEFTFGIEEITLQEAIIRNYTIDEPGQPQGPTQDGTPLNEVEPATLNQTPDLNELFRDFNPETDSSIHLLLNRIRELFKEQLTRSTYIETSGTSVFNTVNILTEYSTLLFRSKLTSNSETPATDAANSANQSDTGMYYVQLGAFLDILNKYIPAAILQNGSSDPLIKLHSDKQIVHRHKTLENLHASVDPGKFILPQTQELGQNFTQRGDILDIFVEIGYLETIVRQKLQDGELRIYELLTGLLGELDIALGKVNSFELQYFEDTFTFHIIDRELIDPSTFQDVVRLELIGKNSTLLNLNLTSKLSPAIGSQLAIAAQADPVSNGIEGTGWAKFNKGLKDRYIPEKEEDLGELIAEQEQQEQKLQEQLARVFLFLDAMYYRQEIGATGIEIPSITTEYGVLCKILLNNEVKAGKDFGTIIPYELNLELEGMSGFEVMRSFVINENIIPRVYRNEEEGIAFLITGLTHKVSAERWTVSVKAQIYNTNTKGLASVTGKLNLKEREDTAPTEPPPPGEDLEWEFYSDSDAVPDFIYDPSTSVGPTSNRTVRLNNSIRTEYLPALDSVQGYSKGLKLLATVMTHREGFRPDTRSYRTNNPGNVGNTDIGQNNTLDTLADGVAAQLRYLTRVTNGTHGAYPLNRDKDIKPYYSPEIAKNSRTYGLTPYLPGYKFTPYKGTLEQFIKIYSTGARGGNGYLSDIISYFKANGYDVNEKTTLEEIDKLA